MSYIQPGPVNPLPNEQSEGTGTVIGHMESLPQEVVPYQTAGGTLRRLGVRLNDSVETSNTELDAPEIAEPMPTTTAQVGHAMRTRGGRGQQVLDPRVDPMRNSMYADGILQGDDFYREKHKKKYNNHVHVKPPRHQIVYKKIIGPVQDYARWHFRTGNYLADKLGKPNSRLATGYESKFIGQAGAPLYGAFKALWPDTSKPVHELKQDLKLISYELALRKAQAKTKRMYQKYTRFNRADGAPLSREAPNVPRNSFSRNYNAQKTTWRTWKTTRKKPRPFQPW